MTTIFVLKGKSPQSWGLKSKGLMIDKPGFGLKHAGYFPGQDSIFVEDIHAKNKDLKPQEVPDFTFNPATNKTELVVNNSDKNLIELLTKHPWYSKRYEIFSEEIESEKALAQFELKEKALGLLKTTNSIEIKSMAMVVFGYDAYGWVENTALSKLKQLAFESPKKIIEKLESKDFESHYIASMAYILGIVKNSIGQNTVVWTSNEQTILSVAKGENGNEKLGDFLASKTNESHATLQEIYSRIEQKNSGISAFSNQEVAGVVLEKDAALAKKDQVISEKDAEIERLKAMLSNQNLEDEGKVNEVSNVDGPKESTIEDLHQIYLNKFNTEVPNRFKNDRDWILTKINE